ncbi:hypothetical protein B0H13DRAFT_1878384 [Mycena leptocephala]|nr:hypothetical protein B0H13DRAFT_1878384 [Mycena leptocephala]
MELLLPFGTSQGTATSPTSSQIPSDYRLDTAIYTTSRHVAERPESSGQWPRYYPPQYLPPLPQFQLPPQPIPFPNQPMYYNYNPHAAAHAWPGSHPSGYPSFLAVGENPMDMEVELALEEPKQHANKPGNKKRKREKAEIGVEITPQAVQADRPQLRRSARTHKPRK